MAVTTTWPGTAVLLSTLPTTLPCERAALTTPVISFTERAGVALSSLFPALACCSATAALNELVMDSMSTANFVVVVVVPAAPVEVTVVVVVGIVRLS